MVGLGGVFQQDARFEFGAVGFADPSRFEFWGSLYFLKSVERVESGNQTSVVSDIDHLDH